MPKMGVVGAVVLSLAGVLGCNTPKKEDLEIHIADPQLAMVEPSSTQTEHAQPKIASYTPRSGATAQALATLLEDMQARQGIDRPPIISIVPSFQLNDDGFTYHAEIRKFYGYFYGQTKEVCYQVDYSAVWSHHERAKVKRQLAASQGVDEAALDDFLSALTISVLKDGKAYFFVDDGINGECDSATIEGISYIRVAPGVFRSSVEPALSAEEVQTEYDKLLEEIHGAYQ